MSGFNYFKEKKENDRRSGRLEWQYNLWHSV